MAGGVDDGEFAGSESEGDVLGGAGGKMDALETDESAKGCAFTIGMRNVEFDDLVTGDGGFVGNAGGDGEGGCTREFLDGCVRSVSHLRRLRLCGIIPSPYGLG